jgi:hypothetical protein
MSLTNPIVYQIDSPETWCPIPEFGGYSVSSLGQVRNDRGRILRPNTRGLVNLYRGGVRYHRSVRRLMKAAGFPQPRCLRTVPAPITFPVVTHIEGEAWARIPDFPHAVSTQGRAVNLNTGHVLQVSKKGIVCLCRGGRAYLRSLQTLVNKTFNGTYSGKGVHSGTRKVTTKHGLSRGGKPTPELLTFNNARHRCQNPKSISYPEYGGRGIQFLFNSVQEMVDALKTPDNPTGLRPEGKDARGRSLYSIDRIDNDWHYGVRPDGTSNIRWATAKEQNQNQRPNRGWARKKPAVKPKPDKQAAAHIGPHEGPKKPPLPPTSGWAARGGLYATFRSSWLRIAIDGCA